MKSLFFLLQYFAKCFKVWPFLHLSYWSAWNESTQTVRQECYGTVPSVPATLVEQTICSLQSSTNTFIIDKISPCEWVSFLATSCVILACYSNSIHLSLFHVFNHFIFDNFIQEHCICITPMIPLCPLPPMSFLPPKFMISLLIIVMCIINVYIFTHVYTTYQVYWALLLYKCVQSWPLGIGQPILVACPWKDWVSLS